MMHLEIFVVEAAHLGAEGMMHPRNPPSKKRMIFKIAN